MPEPFRTESTHELPFTAGELWPILSNTDWLNRSLGLPQVSYETIPLPEGGSKVLARARLFGKELRWEERPFEWCENEYYRVQRLFLDGPLKELSGGVAFEEITEKRTRVRVFSEMTPRNALGSFISKRVLGPKATRDMGRVLGHVVEYLQKREKIALPNLPKRAVNGAAFQAGFGRLTESFKDADLLERLRDFLQSAPDVELVKIRPLALARRWRTEALETIRLFLYATRAGLLDLSWEVLCPNCRSSRQPLTTTLSQLKKEMHCEVCQIRYDAEFDRSVELKFSVNPNIKQCEAQTFCLAGPGGKPHILSQIILQPGQERRWKLPSSTGLSRVRSPQASNALEDMPWLGGSIVVSGIEEGRPVLKSTGCETQLAELSLPNPQREVVVRNELEAPVVLCFERLPWSEDILTAARVSNLQDFRDLFSREVISPAEQVTVGQQIILFTDLRGSTAMYCGIGDAPAYALVREHFAILREAIARHQGAIVKTIGDAVMASFSDPANALSALEEMHRGLAGSRPEIGGELVLKSSLHLGPCLAVNANERLDYFGTTVNLAARLVDCCQGGDLTVSGAFFERAETQAFVEMRGLKAELLEKRFRGFEEPVKVWRIQIM
jgi:adenylate cyclase